ncbi:hypothetical protein A9Q91_05535 [Candidatus Gracilibacteria bacterium 28_42_T64]|nr:hypothetical protein A9Q91_05535 [Candidatus Gracilibacteria bacterium 28_42_T64]
MNTKPKNHGSHVIEIGLPGLEGNISNTNPQTNSVIFANKEKCGNIIQEPAYTLLSMIESGGYTLNERKNQKREIITGKGSELHLHYLAAFKLTNGTEEIEFDLLFPPHTNEDFILMIGGKPYKMEPTHEIMKEINKIYPTPITYTETKEGDIISTPAQLHNFMNS